MSNHKQVFILTSSGVILSKINLYILNTPKMYLSYLETIWIVIAMMSCICHWCVEWIALVQAPTLEEHNRQYPDMITGILAAL